MMVFKMIVEKADLVQQIKNKLKIKIMMVKFNMEKISYLEKKHTGDEIYLNTLQQMLDVIMIPKSPWDSNNSQHILALNTLKDLGVIEEPKTDQQLNS